MCQRDTARLVLRAVSELRWTSPTDVPSAHGPSGLVILGPTNRWDLGSVRGGEESSSIHICTRERSGLGLW